MQNVRNLCSIFCLLCFSLRCCTLSVAMMIGKDSSQHVVFFFGFIYRSFVPPSFDSMVPYQKSYEVKSKYLIHRKAFDNSMVSAPHPSVSNELVSPATDSLLLIKILLTMISFLQGFLYQIYFLTTMAFLMCPRCPKYGS